MPQHVEETKAVVESYIAGKLDDYEACYLLWHMTGVDFQPDDLYNYADGYKNGLN